MTWMGLSLECRDSVTAGANVSSRSSIDLETSIIKHNLPKNGIRCQDTQRHSNSGTRGLIIWRRCDKRKYFLLNHLYFKSLLPNNPLQALHTLRPLVSSLPLPHPLFLPLQSNSPLTLSPLHSSNIRKHPSSMRENFSVTPDFVAEEGHWCGDASSKFS
jgi:hypothetical protein